MVCQDSLEVNACGIEVGEIQTIDGDLDNFIAFRKLPLNRRVLTLLHALGIRNRAAAIRASDNRSLNLIEARAGVHRRVARVRARVGACARIRAGNGRGAAILREENIDFMVLMQSSRNRVFICSDQVVADFAIDDDSKDMIALVRLPGDARRCSFFLLECGSNRAASSIVAGNFHIEIPIVVKSQRKCRCAGNHALKDVVRIVCIVPVGRAANRQLRKLIALGDLRGLLGFAGIRLGNACFVYFLIDEVAVGILLTRVDEVVDRILCVVFRNPLRTKGVRGFLDESFAANIFLSAQVAISILQEPAAKGVAGSGGREELVVLGGRCGYIGLIRDLAAAVAVEADDELAAICLPNGVNRLIGCRHVRDGHSRAAAIRAKCEDLGHVVVIRFRPALEDIARLRRNAAAAYREVEQRCDLRAIRNCIITLDIAQGAAVGIEFQLIALGLPLRNQVVGIAGGLAGIVLLFDCQCFIYSREVARVVDIGRVCRVCFVIRVEQLPAQEAIALSLGGNVLVFDLGHDAGTGCDFISIHIQPCAGGRGNLTAIGNIDQVRFIFRIARANDNGVLFVRGRGRSRGDIIAARRLPAAEFIVLIFRIRSIVRQNDDRVLADDVVVVDRVAIRVFHDDVNRLKDSFITDVRAFVFYPHNDGLCALNLLLESEGMQRAIRNGNPVVLSGRIGFAVGHPVILHAGTAAVFDEGDTIIVDAHARIRQGDGCNVGGRVLAFDNRVLVIEECRQIRLGNFGFIAHLVFDDELERPTARLTGLCKFVIRNLGYAIHPAGRLDNIIFGVVDVVAPLRNFAIRASQRARLGFIHNVDLNGFAAIDKVLQVDRHDLLARRAVLHIEVSQRDITLNFRLLELDAFNIVIIDILRHQASIVVASSDIAVFRAKAQVRQLAALISGGIRNNLAIIAVGDIENLVLIHTVDTVCIRII